MKTAFIIDGFNFYHSIKTLPKKLRWFDYFAYCKYFLTQNDILTSVYYCTALAEWRPDSIKRHKIFISACENSGINVILGRFKQKTHHCQHCKKILLHHEEKETDVNIALTAYRLAANHDQIILVSGDSDLVPAIRAIKEDYEKVKVGVVFPYNRLTRELKQAANFHHKTRRKVLDQFILPPIIYKPDGLRITCPEEWR